MLSKSFQYEDGTNRLASALTVEGVADGDPNSAGGAYVTVANRTYAYDNAGGGNDHVGRGGCVVAAVLQL